MSFTVATYNIHGCVGSDGRYDPDRVLSVLRELDADVIALQELRWDPQDALDLLNHFSKELNFRAIPGPTLLRSDGHYGNALLTRMDVRDVQRIDLSVPLFEARGALNVLLEHGGRSLRVIATHLGLLPSERRRQMKKLLTLCTADTENAVILMGDLNEWFLWGRPLRWLRGHFGPTPEPATYPSRFPLFALDRIWIKPRTQLAHVMVHVSMASRIASDHLPLRAAIIE
jgi:endonuclease/exonuclease/phosphatase family metal-dependent hydrolase